MVVLSTTTCQLTSSWGFPTTRQVGRAGGVTPLPGGRVHIGKRLSYSLPPLFELGTSQMGCMLYAIAEAAGLPKPMYMVSLPLSPGRDIFFVVVRKPDQPLSCCYVE